MKNNYKSDAKKLALSFVAYSSASIFGPLIVISGIGWFLDRLFKTSPVILIVSVFIAFIVTNVLLFKKLKKVNQLIDQYKNKAIKERVEKIEDNKDIKEKKDNKFD